MRSARQDEEDRRRREADRQRSVAEQQRRDAENRRRDEEQRRRQKEKDEEAARRAEEMKQKRAEEELRRKEQASALAVRKVIQRVRIATPETYDDLRAELENAQAEHLESMGSQAEKVSQEAEKALQQAQQRIDEINEKRAADEAARIEEERKRKEEAEKVERIMKEVEGEVEKADGKVKEAEETAKVLNGDSEVTPEKMVETADSTEKIVVGCKEVVDAATKAVDEKEEEMGDNEASRKVRRELADLRATLTGGKRTIDKLLASVRTVREKATKKASALKKFEVRKDLFAKTNTTGGGKLSRKDIELFGKSEYNFEVSAEIMEKIMKVLEPITLEKFQRMRGMVAIARSEKQARQKRAEEEEKRKILEEQKLAVTKVADEANELLVSAEAILDKAEVEMKPISRNSEMPADEMKSAATAVEGTIASAEKEMEQASEKLKQVEEECTATEGLKGLEKKLLPRLTDRLGKLKGHAERVSGAAKAALEKAVRKAYAEVEQNRTEAVTSIRGYMSEKGKTGDQLWEDIGKGSAWTLAQFLGFLKELPELKLEADQSEKLFEHIAGESGEIDKLRFLELIRLFYKCIKATVLTEDISIKSKTVRRLDMGEVLEALAGPTKEEGANVQRVRCQAVQDEAIGWVTIAGNQGTPFLEPGGNFYTCVKETVLTDGLSVQDSKTIRRVTKGEVVEVLEFAKKDASVGVKRIKAKAKLDGTTGWITVSGNQGTSFLEPC